MLIVTLRFSHLHCLLMSTQDQHSSQQMCSEVVETRRIKSFIFRKICLMLGTTAVFIVTMKWESSKIATLLRYVSGFGILCLLYDILASLSVRWLTEQILRRVFEAATYLVKLLFLDLWKSRPKKWRG